MPIQEVKKRNPTQGLALLLVVVYIVLISLAIAGTLMLTLNQARIFETQRTSATRFYYLNAGVQRVLEFIRESPPIYPYQAVGTCSIQGESVSFNIVPQAPTPPTTKYDIVCTHVVVPAGTSKTVNVEVERYVLEGGGALVQVLSWQE